MKKICIVAGARPNFVKVAPLIRAIEQADGAEYELVYTGREDDPTLESSLFDDLQMPRPSVFFGVDSTSLNEITSRVMAHFDAYLDANPADVVIVVDDLASTMAAAIVTKKRGVKLAHLVAGTRSFDMNMPKEVNRLVIDALSDYLFTAGIKSNSVATREQAEGSNTYMVGNILMDTLRFNHQRLRQPSTFNLPPSSYIVLTLNRKALLADEDNLKQMLEVIAETAGDTPIIAPLRGKAFEVVSQLLSNLPSPVTLLPSPTIKLCISVVPMWPVTSNRSNRFKVSVDGGEAVVCENVFKEWGPEWKLQVLENRKEFVVTLPLDKNRQNHTITLSIIDPGQIIQKISYE